MPTKRPEWGKNWEADDFLILLNDVFWTSFEHQVDFNLTSCRNEAERAGSISCVANHR